MFIFDASNLSESIAPVYRKFKGHSLQPAYIVLDADGVIYAAVDNLKHTSIFEGLDKHIPISPFSSAQGIRELFENPEFLAAVCRYYADCLSDDARDALQDIQKMCSTLPIVSVWTAYEWLSGYSLTELAKKVVQHGNISGFYESICSWADADQLVDFNANELAGQLADRFEGCDEHQDVLEIIAAHDKEFAYLLDNDD